jgi:hypothetical protein
MERLPPMAIPSSRAIGAVGVSADGQSQDKVDERMNGQVTPPQAP